MTDELFDSKEAAADLRITVDQLLKFVHDGEIGYVNVGRGRKRPRYRFRRDDLEDFKERRRRREAPCPSIRTRVPRTTVSTSSSVVVGFMAQRAARHARKPSDLNR